MVLMSDGSQKNIGSVKVGDWVMSWDVSQNATVSSVVKELVDGKSDELIVVRKNDMKLVSTSDHPYFCHTTQSLMSFSPSVTTSRYHLSETISQMPSDPILQDQFGEPVRTSVDRLWTDAISVRTLKLSNPYHMFFASGVLVHNKGGGSSSSSSSSSSSGRSSSSSTGRTTPTYSYNSPSTYSQRPTGYSQYSSYYYGSSTARRTYYSGSRRGRVDDIYYREHPVTGNVTCCEDDYFYDDMNENTHSQSCGLVTCEADVGGTDDEFEYVISSYGQSTTKYFSSSDDDTIMEKCCECGGGREMMCPDEGESVAAGVGALLILPIFIGIFCCFCMRKKSSSSSATVGPNADSGFQKFSEPTVWATPPGTYNCFKCSQPCQWKHFCTVAREQNDNTYSEGVWICDGPCGTKHDANINPNDSGIWRCENCRLDLDANCTQGGGGMMAMGQPTMQQPMAMAQPMTMQQPMMMVQQPGMMQQPMTMQQPMMMVQQPGMMQQPMTMQQPMMMQQPGQMQHQMMVQPTMTQPM